MPVAGWKGAVKITGTPTAMVAEATTELVADTVFRITNAARRILDPDAALTVLVNGGAAPAHTINHLRGKITFAAPIGGADVVTVTGNYLPLLDVIHVHEASVQMSRDIADVTVLKGPASTDASRQKYGLLKDASGSIGRLHPLFDDLDAGGGTVKLYELLESSTRKVLDLVLGDSGQSFRSWMLFDSQELQSARDDLINASLSWQSTTDDTGRSTFNVDDV